MAAHRILLVDDHPVVLDGVRALLDTVDDLEVVGEATDRDTAIRLAEILKPDGVVLDLRLHGSYAADTVTSLKAAAPGAVVLIHTATEELEPVRAALRAGADGAVFKDGRDLVPALRAVLAGEGPYVDQRLNRRRGPRRPDDAGGLVEPLSPREYEVLCAFAMGQSTRDIAQELFLAESTVRSYTKSLLCKLGAHSRIEALAAARRVSLI
ncbi:MAG TPA: response regulator transcription factor [Pseudonocardia sp.]|nr:response regulator transcription factor [Pseudonocardia sp.]